MVSGERTKTAAAARALREYVARHEQKRIVELFGVLDWDPRYDYKAERTRGRLATGQVTGEQGCGGTSPSDS